MPYARMDDRWDDHAKIRRAWRRQPIAVALHAMAITYCNRHNNNGRVEADWIEEKLALLPIPARQRESVVQTLLDLKLLEADGLEHYRVHDFLDWNLSREQREKLAEQGRRGGRAGRGSVHPPSDGSSPGSSQGLGDGSSPPDNGGSSTPLHATPTPSPTPEETALARERADTIECFEYWRERTNHPQAKLTEERKRVIRARRRDGYTIEQIRQGIDGAALNPPRDRDSGVVYDDLTSVCRNGAQLERYMERATAQPSPLRVIGGKESASDMLRAIDGGLPA